MKVLLSLLAIVFFGGCSRTPPKHVMTFMGFEVADYHVSVKGDFAIEEDEWLLVSSSGKDFGIRIMMTGISVGSHRGGVSRSGKIRNEPIVAQSKHGKLEILAVLLGGMQETSKMLSRLETYTGDEPPRFWIEAKFVDLSNGRNIGDVSFSGKLE